MKLTDIKKAADVKAAEVEAARELAAQIKELEVHPLLKWDCARSVRDAYFCGIVFAAVSDEDNVVDDVERKVIDRIGRSLALSEDEVEEIVKSVTEVVKTAISGGGVDVFALLEESSNALRDKNVFQLFVAEYVKVCGAKEVVGTDDVRNQLTSYACAHTGIDLDLRFYKALCRCLVSPNEVKGVDLVALSEFLGDEVLRYLMLDSMGDVLDRLKTARKSLAAKDRSRKEKSRLARARNAFDAELSKIGEYYQDAASMPADWKDDIEGRLLPYESADIDWVATMDAFLHELQQVNPRRGMLLQRLAQKRRKLIWKLVGMLWVAEKTVRPAKIDNLLRVARSSLSTDGFIEKVQNFIQEGFEGVVELEEV